MFILRFFPRDVVRKTSRRCEIFLAMKFLHPRDEKNILLLSLKKLFSIAEMFVSLQKIYLAVQ